MWLFLTAALVLIGVCLVTFPRQTLIALGGLLGLAALGGGYLWWDSEGRQRYVDVAVNYAPTTAPCSTEFPLRVLVSNQSSSVVNSTTWYFSAFAPGRSTNLAGYQSYSSDQIIYPNYVLTLCYKLPTLAENIDPARVVWGVKSKYVSFGN
jgi:hypothetical protein